MNRSSKLLAAGLGALAMIAAVALTTAPAQAHYFYRYGFARPVFFPRPVFFRPYFVPPPPPVYVVPRVAYIPPPPPVVYGYRYHRVVYRHVVHHLVHKVVHHTGCTCSCCPTPAPAAK
jgi:hypothetical protein